MIYLFFLDDGLSEYLSLFLIILGWNNSHETQPVQESYNLLLSFKVAFRPGATVLSDLCKGCTDSSDILESDILFRKRHFV